MKRERKQFFFIILGLARNPPSLRLFPLLTDCETLAILHADYDGPTKTAGDDRTVEKFPPDQMLTQRRV